MQKEHFEIILEDINSKLSNIAEGYQILHNKIDESNKKNDANIKELRDEMIVRFDYLDRKIDTKIDEVTGRMDKIEYKLDKVTENHEQRITKLETKAA